MEGPELYVENYNNNKWPPKTSKLSPTLEEDTLTCASPLFESWVFHHDEQHNMAGFPEVTPVTDRPVPFIPIPGSVIATMMCSILGPPLSSPMSDTAGLIASMFGPAGSAWDALRSTASSSGCYDQDPVSAAAHLHLLGESLSLIGLHLQETNKSVCMSSGMSLLLDSLLCALAPLICLTTQIPELKSCTEHTLVSTLENIAYVMPGL